MPVTIVEFGVENTDGPTTYRKIDIGNWANYRKWLAGKGTLCNLLPHLSSDDEQFILQSFRRRLVQTDMQVWD